MSPQIKALGLFLVCLSLSGATLRGRVVEDQTGVPIASADVRLHKTGDRLLAANPDTDGDGRFEASNLSDGDYTLDVSKSNHLNATLRLHIADAESTVTVRLARGAVISGQVHDTAGRRIAGAVLAIPASGGPLIKESATGRTSGIDAQGNYRIANLSPGEYQLATTFASEGGGPRIAGESGSNSGVVFYPDNVRPQTLTLSSGEEHPNVNFVVSVPDFYTISGKVELPEPKARFFMTLVAVNQPAIAVATVYALPDGTFKFQGVPPGSYTLLATTGPMVSPSILPRAAGIDGRFARTQIDVAGQNIEGLSLVSQPGPAVTLLLRSTGSCPRSAQVTLNAVDDWGVALTRQIVLNADEERKLPGIAPVRFAVSVAGSADCFALTNPVFDASAEVPQAVVVTLAPAGSIRGRSKSAAPIAIVLLPADGPMQVAFPDAASYFSFTGLRPGKYRVAARPAVDGSDSHWIPDLKQMIEVQVAGDTAIEIEL